MEHSSVTTQGTVELTEQLLGQRAAFLRFLASRVGPGAAEDILQSAYLKAIQHGSEIRNEESTVAWFYRVLRNSIADYYRRSGARESAHEQFASESPVSYEVELQQTVCACIGDVVRDLKEGYRTAIEQVDLGGSTVEAFAESQGTTANNASVRLHRARKALAKRLTAVCGVCAEHKCLDCSCKRSKT